MNTDYIFLNPTPMPYLTDCDYKKFEPNEYHISRIVDFFVLIFMLRSSLHFIEDGVSVRVQEGEWYIQRKNLLQGADRPSPGAEFQRGLYAGSAPSNQAADPRNLFCTAVTSVPEKALQSVSSGAAKPV